MRPGQARGQLRLGEEVIDLCARVLVMGIVNRTPDSFFDQGAYFSSLAASIDHAAGLVAGGADLIDVGGVRAGPGEPVGLEEELERVVPFIEAFTARFSLPVSVDTWNAAVAGAAYRAGAVLGNDISGFSDPDYLPTAATAGASVVATHIRLAPRVDDPHPSYDRNDVVGAVESYLSERRDRAIQAGLGSDQVLLDAGFDLGKTSAQSLELLRATGRLAQIGPVLLSCSNKGFLGELFDLQVTERREANLSAISVGIELGGRVVRVHDVAGARRVADTFMGLWGAR